MRALSCLASNKNYCTSRIARDFGRPYKAFAYGYTAPAAFVRGARPGPGYRSHSTVSCRARRAASLRAAAQRVPSTRQRTPPHLAMQHCCDPYASLRKHPELFDEESGWREEWLDGGLVSVLRQWRAGDEDALLSVVKEEAPGIHSFDLFRPEFCKMFLEELDNYYASGLPIRRPNSMNNYGIIVNDIGLKGMMTRLQQEVLWPIARVLFPREGSQFSDHHSFMVQYKQGQDLGLDMHTDDSDVTFNICMGREFTGAGLTFCGVMGTATHRKVSYQYQHKIGRCLVHLGAQRHGADDISSGERNNLIIWNHNDIFRSSPAYLRRLYEKEDGPPDVQCLSYTHDRDYGAFKEYPEGKEEFKNMSWCPPSKYCYDQMEPIKQIKDT